MSQLLELVELKLKEVILRQPTLLVMVVGVPNVGKSALINSIHRISAKNFPGNFLNRLFVLNFSSFLEILKWSD